MSDQKAEKNIIAVSSGKGGVGKTTVSVNLAVTMAQQGAKVGLMDADIYGPNIPMMMGINDKPRQAANGKIAPLEKYGLKIISIGFLAGENAPLIWRGPIVSKIIQQFLSDVDWGDLDYLFVDMPPGTGDAQLTLTQAAALAGGVIVSTPQDVALGDAMRGVRMFEQVKVPILGLVENMSYYVCTKCGERAEIFDHGGGRHAAEKYNIPFLGEVPLDTRIRVGGDKGVPIVVAEPDSVFARVFHDMAKQLAANISMYNVPQKFTKVVF
ncbi:Mrp/NBP35 family ATP-binding protein [candidate division KSB1 bacterium]|nr:Mrp/NBP35 family ATP-binding protein [candidate division KSB1 bacterium]